MTSIGRYQLVEKLGQGGMGVVYRAFDTLLQRVVALKVISGSVEASTEQRERFFREARAAGQLSHRNIITIHDLGEHDGQPYLAMEYLEGEDLQRRLDGHGRMSLAHKVDLAIQICEGLDYAHTHGVVHRDIKPANIFLTEGGTAKILDFGLARLVTSELTNSNMMMGTINYMAPEQVRGERADQRSDIFSVGVVFYELLGGRKAFDGESFAATLYKILQEEPAPLVQLDPGLPRDLIAIVERALAKPRDERYQHVADMLRDLAVFRQQLSTHDAAFAGRPPSGGDGRPSDPPRVRPGSGQGPAPNEPTVANVATPFPPVPAGPHTAGSARRGLRVWIPAAAVVLAVTALLVWAERRAQPTSPMQPSASARPAVDRAAAAPAATPVPPLVDEGHRESRRQPDTAGTRTADDARTTMTQAKLAARAARAATLAPAAYDAALRTERAAQQLYDAARLDEATAKFYEASGLFRSAEFSAQSEAASRAQAAKDLAAQSPAGRPAAQTPEHVVPAPPPAPPPQPPSPATPEPQPVSSPAKAAEPVQLGSTAVVVPPKLASPPSAPAPEGTADNAISDLIGRYQAALEARDLDALKRFWPGLRGGQESALRSEFQHASRIAVEVGSPHIIVSGAAGTATFVRRYELVTTDGQRLASASLTTMTFRRTSGGWVIDQVRFEPVR